jgi:hypothetical protein
MNLEDMSHLHDLATRMNIYVDTLLVPHPFPKTIRDYSENNGNWLTGLEEYLSKRLGFYVNIFTSQQKKYLHTSVFEKSFMCIGIRGKYLLVGPVTYQKLKQL